VTDRLRLRTMRADIEAASWKHAAEPIWPGLACARSSAPTRRPSLDVDDTPLETQNVPTRELAAYSDLARTYRPEVKALDKAAAARRALADLEWRRQYLTWCWWALPRMPTPARIDHPQNAFANNPFNTSGVGPGGRFPHAARSFRQERTRPPTACGRPRKPSCGAARLWAASTSKWKRPYTEMKEADQRLKTVQKGEKPHGNGLRPFMQNISVGLAETKDFSDALLAFFQSRMRHLQGLYDYNIAVASLTQVAGVDVRKKPD